MMIKNSHYGDRILKKQIKILNRYLPRHRKTLADLLNEEKPHVWGADGTRHRFRGFELKKLSLMIPKSKHEKLKLPIYIEIESMTPGARISGNLECGVVGKILNIKSHENEIFVYKPDIKILRRELPSTTQYIFIVR